MSHELAKMEKGKEPLLASAASEHHGEDGELKRKGDKEQLAIDKALANQVWHTKIKMYIITLCGLIQL